MNINLDDWDMLPVQRSLYENDQIDTLVFAGGLGSGKTHVMCRKALKLSAINQGHSGAILCPSYKDFRRDVKPELDDILENRLNLKQGKHWRFHGSFFEYRFVWNKHPLYILSGEQPIAGPNLAYCLINEFSLIQWERVKEMLRRVRVKNAPLKQRILVGTPEDVHGWLEDFIEKKEEENIKKPDAFRLLHSDTMDNIHLDPEYRAHLESMLDDQALKVFAGGQIVKIGGNYFYYAFDRSKNITDKHDYTPGSIVYANLDFNVGRMSATFAHKYGEHTHYFDEAVLTGYSDGTEEMAQHIVERFGSKDVYLTIDASGKSRKTSGYSDVDILLRYFPSAHVRYKKQNPRFRERQLLICGRLHRGLITFHPRMKKTIKDMEKVRQLANFEKDKKNADLTHLSDSVDYLEDFEFSLAPLRRTQTIEL